MGYTFFCLMVLKISLWAYNLIVNTFIRSKHIFLENNKIETLFSNYIFGVTFQRWTLESKSECIIRKQQFNFFISIKTYLLLIVLFTMFNGVFFNKIKTFRDTFMRSIFDLIRNRHSLIFLKLMSNIAIMRYC